MVRVKSAHQIRAKRLRDEKDPGKNDPNGETTHGRINLRTKRLMDKTSHIGQNVYDEFMIPKSSVLHQENLFRTAYD